MQDMAERLISPISTAELERRWAAVRAAMAAQKIDVLVMQNSNVPPMRPCVDVIGNDGLQPHVEADPVQAFSDEE